jgi:Fe-S-cluster containining protein
MPVHFLPGQNFDCSLCSKCCRGWRISVDSATRERLVGSTVELRVLQQTGKPALQQNYAAKHSDGSCVFLDPENLCSIQTALGAEAKPRGCRHFPFRLCRTPDGIFAGVSFYCSAAQRNEGRPLAEHADALAEFFEDLPMVGVTPMPLGGAVTLTWDGYIVLDAFLLRDPAGVGRALWAVAQLVGRGRGVVGPAEMSEMLERSEVALHPPRQPFFLMERHFFARLVARTEVDEERLRPAFELDLTAHRELVFARFGGWRARLPDIERAGEVDEAELRRYLQALVFRKFLIAKRTVLDNLAMLYLAPTMVAFWTGLGQLSGTGDFRRAIDECEYRLFTHPAGLDELYRTVADGFLEQLDLV